MREMKQSGIPWIGEIPDNWEITRIKNNFFISGGSTPTSSNPLYWDGKISWITPADMADFGWICNGNRFLTVEGFNACGTQMASKGDIVISTRAPIGKVNICEKELCTNQGCKTLSNEKEDNRYSAYYLFSIPEVLNIFGKGTTFLELSAQELSIFPLIFPPLPEQTAIADFLDLKCEKIDTIIAIEETIISELNEYKKSIIQKAVTKGISNFILKDSGIEWLGKIPQNWETVRIGAIYQMRNTKVSDIDYPPLSVGYMGVVPQLENAAKTDDGYNRKLVLKNDFVINSRADRRGACGISEIDGSVSLINIVLKPLKDACNNYYRYLFKSTGFSDEFYKWGNGIVDDLWSTKWSEMKRIYITVPSPAEQQSIAEYLDKKLSQVDNLITLKQQKITELKEYKKSLIYEYVTGKKEVPA